MVQHVEAWGNRLEFPDDMSDEEMSAAIRKNEIHLNPDASTYTKAKSGVSKGVDAGLSMLTPKRSIADQAQEQPILTGRGAAPQVKDVPIRQDYYQKMVAEPVKNPASGIVSRVRDTAARDTNAQLNKKAVSNALISGEPVPEEGGFINSAGRTVGQNIKGAGQIGADYLGADQNNAVKQYGQNVIDANPTGVNSLEDIAARPGTAVAEATGNAAPSMAGMIGARAIGQGITALSPLAGPAAPIVAAAGQVVSWLGPAAIAALPSYGGIRDKQILNDPKNEKDAKAIAIATMGAAAVGAIEQSFGPQQWALAAMTKEGRVQLAKKFAATTLPGSIGKGAIRGAAIEGAEELAQNPIEQLASFDNPTTKANIKETVFGGAMGAISGGVLGGGGGMILGKPVTETSNGVLKYTATRGGKEAKERAQAELDRRAKQGVDPAIANAPESTTEAVDRIISTGKDKAAEITGNAAAGTDAIQSSIFDEEPDHIVDANKMVDGAQPATVQDSLTVPDAPTPEPVETFQDVATDGSQSVMDAARKVAGMDGTIEDALSSLDELKDAAKKREQQNSEWSAKLSGMTSSDLAASYEKAVEHNNSVDEDAVLKFFGANVAEQFTGWGKRKRDSWWDENATNEMDDFASARHVPEDLVSEFRNAAFDFDTESPRDLGRSIALVSRDVDKPGFFQTPDGARFRNAMRYAKDKGWNLDDVVAGMQSRGAEWAGRDVKELFPRLFGTDKTNKPKATATEKPSIAKPAERGQNSASTQQTLLDFKSIENRIADAVANKKNDGNDLLAASQLYRAAQDAHHRRGYGSSPETTAELNKHADDAFSRLQEAADNLDSSQIAPASPAREARDAEDSAYHYSDGDLGMTSKGSFTKDKSRWMPFTPEEATRMANGGIKPHGATRMGMFVGVDSNKRLTTKTSNGTSNSSAKDKQVKPPASPKKEAAPAPAAKPAELPGARPLVESLIKRRSAARQGGKDLSKAIDRAKELMDGKREPSTVEHRYFRLQAKAFERADTQAADILRQIGELLNPKKAGLSVPEVEKHIAPLQKAGFKKVKIAATGKDLPKKIQGAIKSANAAGVRGAYYPQTDEVWLVADKLNDGNEAIMVALHEARHRGLRKLFGDGVAPIMRQIYGTNKRVRDATDRMMKSIKGMTKEEAVEEVLADMAIDKTAHELNGWKRLVKFIQQWLTDHDINFTFTDAMVESLVAGAETEGIAATPQTENGSFDPSNPDIRFSRATDSIESTGDFRKEAAKAIKENADKNKRFREEHITLWDKSKKWLKRQLAPGGLLPTSVFAEKMSRDNEFSAIEFDVAHLVGKVERAIKTDYGLSAINLDEKTQQLLSDVLAGKLDSNVPENTKTALIGMRQYIDSLSMRYVESLREQAIEQVAMATITGDKALMAKAEENAHLQVTIMGNLGEYVHRSYRAFDDPQWAKKIPDKVINDARQYLIERNLETMDKAAAARKAEIILNEIVKHGTAYDNMAAFITESKLGAKDLSVLKTRKQITPEIRALLGEYRDPRINFAKSATKMGRLIFNQKFLENIRKDGFGKFMFTDDTKPPEATSKIAADASEVLAPLNGLWVTPEVEQAFKDALGKEHMEDWYKKIVQINGMVKYGKTVLSPTTAARNWMSAFFFAVANGHFDMRHIAKSVSGLREYFAHGGNEKKMAYLRELKQLGVVYDTPYAGEMMRLLADTNVADTLILGKKKLNIKGAFDMATKFYQYGDDFWKIIGFENEKRMWMNTGMTEQEAKVKAAERIRNTYPTYSMIGKGIQALRRFPLAGTFVSFPAEIVRTSANMLKYLADDYKNPKTRSMAVRRGIGLGIASSFAFAAQALSMAMLGFDDDDDEAVRKMAAPWQRNSNLLYTGRDAHGNIRYMDMSFLDPYNYWKRPIMAVLRDQPADDSLKDILKEALTPFFGTDILAGTVFEVMANKKETGAPVFKAHDDPVSQVVDMANHIRKTVQPGIFNNMERTYKALDGEVTRSGKKYDPQDEAAAWFGFRMSTLDSKVSLYYRSFDFQDAKSEAEKKLRDVVLNPNEIGKTALRDTFDDTIKIRAKAFNDMTKLSTAAMRGGLTQLQVTSTLRNGGISTQDAWAIVNDKVPKWRVPESAGKQSVKARSSLGSDAGKRVMERYRELSGIAATQQ